MADLDELQIERYRSYEEASGVSRDAICDLAREGLAAQWRPIETAPKDGAEVLLFIPPNQYEVGYWGEDVSDNDGWTEGRDLAQLDPTHWIPLPNPPAPQARSETVEPLIDGEREEDWRRALRESKPWPPASDAAMQEREEPEPLGFGIGRHLMGSVVSEGEPTNPPTPQARGEGDWDKNADQDALCVCGHPYYRHFDTYEDMAPVGCKYCVCGTFSPSHDAGTKEREEPCPTCGEPVPPEWFNQCAPSPSPGVGELVSEFEAMRSRAVNGATYWQWMEQAATALKQQEAEIEHWHRRWQEVRDANVRLCDEHRTQLSEAQAEIERLRGTRFSERNYTAIKSQLSEAQAEIEKLKADQHARINMCFAKDAEIERITALFDKWHTKAAEAQVLVKRYREALEEIICSDELTFQSIARQALNDGDA